MTDFRSHEEIVRDVVGRYSVTDLVEQTDADLERGDEMFYKAAKPIDIVDGGQQNLIDWWQVRSGEKIYEVRRFKNFVWCSCKDFFFNKRMCKHLAFTTGVYCQRCRVLRAKKGKFCYECDYTIHRWAAPAATTT